MSANADEWLKFAGADLRAARLLLADTAVPSRIACFTLTRLPRRR